MFEQIPVLAAAIALPTEAEQPLLAALCASAEDEMIQKLRPGLAAEDCGETFLCAAALTAAAGLISCRSGADVEQFSAGDVSLRTGGSGLQTAEAMRKQAAGMMAPYWADDRFAFAGVRG